MCRISYYLVVWEFFLKYFDTHSISEDSGGWSCCIQMGGNWMGMFLFPAKCQREISNLVFIHNFDIGIESSDFTFYIFSHFPIPLPRLTFPRPRPRPHFPLFPWPRKRSRCAFSPRGFDGVTRRFGWTFFSRDSHPFCTFFVSLKTICKTRSFLIFLLLFPFHIGAARIFWYV